jgi:cytochrome c biogenesis protein CcmG/thiol:disulfide interchange protein DsbE
LQFACAQAGPAAALKTTPKEPGSEMIPEKSRHAAPDFNLSDLGGKRLTLSQYRGKVVLLDFWAVDCGGCIIEIPWYVEFDQKYRDKGLVVIGIDMYNEAPDYVRPFMSKSHMQYSVAIGNDGIRKQFQADELPKTLLIDRQGEVAVSHIGIVDKTSFEHDIQRLLQ